MSYYDDDELLYREMNPEDEWYMGDDYEEEYGEEYDDADDDDVEKEVVEEEQQCSGMPFEVDEDALLNELQRGKYRLKSFLQYGSLVTVDNIAEGFCRAQMRWDMRGCPVDKPTISVTVKVGELELELDAASKTWGYFGWWDIENEDLTSWLNTNISVPTIDEKGLLRYAFPQLQHAQGALHGWDYYNINGELFYYFDPIMFESEEVKQRTEELKKVAKKLKKREAAQMLREGNFELVVPLMDNDNE